MSIVEALKKVNKTFKYKKDTAVIDKWSIMKEPFVGDCEDYSLTVMYHAENESLFKLLLGLVTLKYMMYFVKLPSGESHMITRHNGLYFDNVQRKLVTKEQLLKNGYTRFIYAPFPLVFFKMLVGKIL